MRAECNWLDGFPRIKPLHAANSHDQRHMQEGNYLFCKAVAKLRATVAAPNALNGGIVAASQGSSCKSCTGARS